MGYELLEQNASIDGVTVKDVEYHSDNRGTFAEILRESDSRFLNFGQLSWSVSHQGVKKAWHIHNKQTDLMFVVSGDAEIVLYDTRSVSPTFNKLQRILVGESYGRKCVMIPPRVAHGYMVINGPMHMIYLMDYEFDGSDELRIPHDDQEIGFDWVSIQEIK